MINPAEFQALNYRQTLDTCILASYAAACFPFTQRPVLDYFVAYCQLYGLDETQPELAYCQDFHQVRTQGRSGYELIRALHNSAPQTAFAEARVRAILSKPFDLAARCAAVEKFLRRPKRAALMAFVHTPDLEELGDHHSVVLGCNDLNSFFVCDTNHGGLWGTIDSIADLGRVGHGMLIVERN